MFPLFETDLVLIKKIPAFLVIKCNIFATKVHTGFLFTGAPPGRTSPKSQTGVLIQALEFGTFLKKSPTKAKVGTKLRLLWYHFYKFLGLLVVIFIKMP